MEVKRLFAANMKDAMTRVRDELGDAAMIIDSRTVAGGVEITAALDLPTSRDMSRDTRRSASPATSADAALSARSSSDGVPLHLEQVRERLLAAGFSVQHLASRLPTLDSNDWVRSLARHLPVAGRSIAPENGRWAVVGPAGGGKTTLVSNLVANHALRYGPDNAALISLDTWRAGGAEQLKIIARLLNVPVFVARDAGDIARMLKAVEGRSLVVVDTPGFTMTPNGFADGRRLLEPLAELLPLVLAIPATLNLGLQHDLLAKFGALSSGVALTHVDEAQGLGEVLEVVQEHQKFLWWLGCGPGIPDDIDTADGAALARRLLGLSNGGGVLSGSLLSASLQGRSAIRVQSVFAVDAGVPRSAGNADSAASFATPGLQVLR